MTAPATATPINMPNAITRRAANDVQAAWSAAPRTVRALTIGAALAALSSSVSADVPLASGLTIATLVPAALVDWHQRRLPDAVVLTAAVAFAFASLAVAASGTNTSVASVALGVAMFAGPLLVVHLASPRSMGFGDVKAAAVLGAAVGAVDWGLAPWALTAAAATAAIIGVARRRATVPFGPSLVAGALSVILATAALGLNRIGF